MGNVVIAFLVFITLSVAYLILGPEGSYRPGTYDVIATWIGISVVLSFAGTVLGGVVSARMARSATPPKILAGIVLVLGLAMALMTETPDTTPARVADPSVWEAAGRSRQPGLAAVRQPTRRAAGCADRRVTRTAGKPRVRA